MTLFKLVKTMCTYFFLTVYQFCLKILNLFLWQKYFKTTMHILMINAKNVCFLTLIQIVVIFTEVIWIGVKCCTQYLRSYGHGGGRPFVPLQALFQSG